MLENTNKQSSNHELDKVQNNLGYEKTQNIKKNAEKHQSKRIGSEGIINIEETIYDGKKMKYQTEYIIATLPSADEKCFKNLNPNLKLFYIFKEAFDEFLLFRGLAQSDSVEELASELVENIKFMHDNYKVINGIKELATVLFIVKNQDMSYNKKLKKELTEQENELFKKLSKDSKINLKYQHIAFIEKEDVLKLLGCAELLDFSQNPKLLKKTKQIENYYNFFKHNEEYALESMIYLVNNENTMIHKLLKESDVFAYCIMNNLHVDFPYRLKRIADIANEMVIRINK